MTSRRAPLLITGGAGFIGSNLVLMAMARGRPVVNLDALTYAGNRGNLSSIEGSPDHIFVHGSINDRTLVRELLTRHRPLAILNLAAESHVDRSIDAPATFIETNIVGTFVLLESAREYVATLSDEERSRFRFLHVSTDEVYGSIEAGAATEESEYKPNSPYASSKASADHLVRAYGKTYGLPVLTTNCTNNYGPYQFPEKLIPLMVLNAFHGKPLPVYGDGGQVRDWLHVEDHCRALLTVLEKGEPHEKYNISAENCRTNKEIVAMICKIMAEVRPFQGKTYESLITPVKDRPGHDRRYALNAAKIRSSLGWTPSIAFDEGLRSTILWYLEHEAWWREIQEKKYAGQRLGEIRA
jgi:dTDP-glucose 4,6-dehydratase